MSQYVKLPLSEIQADPNQPRKDFKEDALEELAKSVKKNGVIQPIKVRKTPAGQGDKPYMIIYGERRWRASIMAGVSEIPALLEDEIGESDLRTQQLIENVHRDDLNPVEQAEFIERRLNELKGEGVSSPVEALAEEMGYSASRISKARAILRYGEDLRELARDGKIRDYELLKKLEKLKGSKRNVAVNELRQGTFNSKEFFKRKRYDKTPDKDKEQTDTRQPTAPVAVEKSEQRREKPLIIPPGHVKALISQTDFRYVLQREDPAWQDARGDRLNQMIDIFKAWLADHAAAVALESKDDASRRPANESA